MRDRHSATYCGDIKLPKSVWLRARVRAKPSATADLRQAIGQARFSRTRAYDARVHSSGGRGQIHYRSVEDSWPGVSAASCANRRSWPIDTAAIRKRLVPASGAG